MEVPPNFDDDFLSWFRDRTNEAWARWDTSSFASHLPKWRGVEDWERGTRWQAGLSEAEIEHVEAEWSVRFPRDYRLFLQRLHTVDRPMKGGRPSFYNWQRDRGDLRRAFAWPLEGLLFDLEHDYMWLEGWGPKPASLNGRQTRLKELVEGAPQLIPVSGIRYLLAEPCVSGNPVLSVMQGDIIIDSDNLRSYFLGRFADILGLGRPGQQSDAETIRKVHAIQFWGEVIVDNEGPEG